MINSIIVGDCLDSFKKVPDGTVDLVFADPPYNINFTYDVIKDKLPTEDYLNWCELWIKETYRVLKPNGTFWLAIGDNYAAELKILSHYKIGYHLRSWVIWHYTFGVNCKNKFTRSHTHLLYFVKNPKNFIFNVDDIRVPSARQLKYKDKRASSKGRLPDDTWQFSRVCGTFKEREGWIGCQMPLSILHRIILASSNKGDLVLDPFVGSGTTLIAAKNIERNYLGFEISENYVRKATERLNSNEKH